MCAVRLDEFVAIPHPEYFQDQRVSFQAPESGQVIAEMHRDEDQDERGRADSVGDAQDGPRDDSWYERLAISGSVIRICSDRKPHDDPSHIVAMADELDVLGIIGERLKSASIPFMLTGSFALGYYGKPRKCFALITPVLGTISTVATMPT